jgi:hypothetical protein
LELWASIQLLSNQHQDHLISAGPGIKPDMELLVDNIHLGGSPIMVAIYREVLPSTTQQIDIIIDCMGISASNIHSFPES